MLTAGVALPARIGRGARRLVILVTAIAAIAVVIAPTASAKPARAVISHVELYKAHNGSLVVTAWADLTGHLRDVRRPGDATARLTLRLSDGAQSAVARDLVKLTHSHQLGTPARFRLVFPARRARLIDTGKRVSWTARLERSALRTSRTTRQGFFSIPSLCSLMVLTSAQPRQGGCGSSFPPQPTPPPPPSPPVGFSTFVIVDAYENYQSLELCVYFGGANYRNPYIGMLSFNDSIPTMNNAANVNSKGDGRQSYPVAADGSFSFPGTYVWTYGGPSIPVTITGNVPASILSAPPNASTGAATASYTPAQQWVTPSFSAAYSPSVVQQLSMLC